MPYRFILNTGPRGGKGRRLPSGIRKACSRWMRSRSHSPSVMTRIGPSAGKSPDFSSRSIPGWRTVPPLPRTRTLPATSSVRRHVALVVGNRVAEHHPHRRDIVSDAVGGNRAERPGQQAVVYRAGGVEHHAERPAFLVFGSYHPTRVRISGVADCLRLSWA